MARKAKEKPIDIPASLVDIRVYPFDGDKPIQGWITQDMLDTVAGGPAKTIRIEVYRPPSESKLYKWYLTAIECLKKQGYRRVTVVFESGERLAL